MVVAKIKHTIPFQIRVLKCAIRGVWYAVVCRTEETARELRAAKAAERARLKHAQKAIARARCV